MAEALRSNPSVPRRIVRLAPGVGLCVALALAAALLQRMEVRLAGRAWLEALVLAILCGAAVRTAWRPDERFAPGVSFSAKAVLEAAIVLLGAGVSVDLIVGSGPWLTAGVGLLVLAGIAISYTIGRGLGLPHRLAVLIACGNSICGNSAIAAVAPVIGAEEADIAASIAFTAVLGVAVVLILPPTAALLHMSPRALGALAGLTVYAVPQVLPATAAAGAASVQMGVLVKLTRVLMLGPVLLAMSLAAPGGTRAGGAARRLPTGKLVPWFMIGFMAMVAVRSAGWIPSVALAPLRQAATSLTIVSMAALGLGVDVRSVAKAGPRVSAAVVLSLLALGALALALIRLAGVR